MNRGMKHKEKRGGIPALFATFKLLLGNYLARLLLKAGSAEVTCHYEGKRIEKSIIYHALSMYSGVNFNCPISVRFTSFLINSLIKLGINIMKGREEDVIEALKDPAIRRGVTLVLQSIGEYGVTVPQKLLAPFMIVWNFTNMCNLRCKHCYQNARRPLSDELTLEEKFKLIEELDEVGIASIALSGGEPTLHPDFIPVIKFAASKGIYTAVATNGWKFADIDFLKKAKEAGLRYVEVSIDSANPRKHDEFRGVEGSWYRAVKALENAVKLNMSAAMATTLTKDNINEIDEILDLAEDIGVKRVVFFNFVPVGRGREIIELDLDPILRENILRKLYFESRKRGLEIVSTAPQYGRVVLQCSGGEVVAPTHFVARSDPGITALAEFIGGCGAGRIYCAIQPNGDVTPCVFMPIIVGNIRYTSFRRIWLETPLLRELRDKDKLKGICGQCPYRYVCGGCRARAYAYLNDPLGPDPGCLFNLRIWRTLKEHAIGPKEQKPIYISIQEEKVSSLHAQSIPA